MHRFWVAAAFLSAIFMSGAVAEAQCDSTSELFATTPSPPTSSRSYRLFQKQQASMQVPADIVMIGDSITRRWPPEMLSSAFPDQHILNLGIEGDRTQNALWRLERYPLRNVSPRAVTVLLGTNDLSALATPCEIEAGLSADIRLIREAWPMTHIILIGISKRGADLRFREVDREKVNAKIAEIAKAAKMDYLDVDRILSCAPNRDCPYYEADMLHYKLSAYSALSVGIKQLIEN